MFGSCKSIYGKYSNFQKCYLPERKMFSCVWLYFKIFFEKYFLVFGKEVEKEEGRGKTQKNPNKPRRTRRDLAKRRSRSALREIDGRERCFARSRRRIAIVLAFFLSLVLPLRELSLCVPSSGNHLK